MPERDIDKVVHHYLVCALWSSNDESDESGGEPIDQNYGVEDVAPESVAAAKADCESFLKQAEDAGIDSSWWTDEQMGHDIWLTRNHHGAGFWDRGQGEPGQQLTKIAHALGEAYAFVMDDTEVYIE